MSVAAQPLTTEDSALSPWWLCMVLLEASDHLDGPVLKERGSAGRFGKRFNVFMSLNTCDSTNPLLYS